jgi:hypothetical protein
MPLELPTFAKVINYGRNSFNGIAYPDLQLQGAVFNPIRYK